MHPDSSGSTQGALLRSGQGHSAESWRAAWTEAFGPAWPAYLALLAVLVFVTGAALPLSDPDLGMHLATGEWIVRRGAVPFEEPFAWTRAGAPYYAYSWLLEVVYYKLLQWGGGRALHLLQGAQYLLVAAVIFPLGRALGWSAWTIVMLAAGSLVVTLDVTPFLRPQVAILYQLPLAWALVYSGREAENPWPYALALFVLGASASNTHFLFPIVGAPCVLLLTERSRRPLALFLLPGAIAAGWLCTPYMLHLPDVLRLNLGYNLMLQPPMRIREFTPGFQSVLRSMGGTAALALLLCVLPWITASRMRAVERALLGGLWFIGLLLFAGVVRGISLWWLLALPMTGAALQLLPAPSSLAIAAAQRVAVVVLAGVLVGGSLDAMGDPWLRAGNVRSRYLPSIESRAVEPIARWLDCNTRDRAPARLTTMFGFGSWTVWRLPWYSASIDGRTIFPDSVAAAEVFLRPPLASLPVAPWKDADLAIAVTSASLAPVLDSAAGWRRTAIAASLDGQPRLIALWVREGWWAEHGAATLPVTPLAVYHRDPASASCQR